MDRAGAMDVLQVFLLGLAVAYLSTLAAAGVVIATDITDRE